MSVKQEEDYESDVSVSPSSPARVKEEVKAEQDGGDDDDYEDDAPDLDLHDANSQVWLVRMPKFLLEELHDGIDEFSGRELGKVRIQRSNPTGGANRVRVVLNQETPQLRNIPHHYDLTMTHPKVDSTYMFMEEDVPRKRPAPEGAANRRTIKKTALVGKVGHEFTLTPDFNDPNYRAVVQRRREMELPQRERQTTLLDTASGVNGMRYGTTLRQQREVWYRPHQRRQQNRINTEGKATRMPPDRLLDMLFKLFEEEKFWTLKGLRERTRQPETYLREMLEKIAVLNKRGEHAMRYGLKEEFSNGVHNAAIQSLVDEQQLAHGDGSGIKEEMQDDDLDESDGEMENVALS